MAPGRILIATIGQPHGVHGRVRLYTYNEDPAALPGYGPFTDDRGRVFSVRWWRAPKIAEITEIVGGEAKPVTDRNMAGRLKNTRLYAHRDRLPEPGVDEFYWVDLIGLEAIGLDGTSLGRVAAVHDYGAGASLEIGSRFIPFTHTAVPSIDLAAGRMTVAPPEEGFP